MKIYTRPYSQQVNFESHFQCDKRLNEQVVVNPTHLSSTYIKFNYHKKCSKKLNPISFTAKSGTFLLVGFMMIIARRGVVEEKIAITG